MILFSYLTDFSYCPVNLFSESCWTRSEQAKKMTIFKGGVDCFSYFSLISVILFSNQDPGHRYLFTTVVDLVFYIVNILYFSIITWL